VEKTGLFGTNISCWGNKRGRFADLFDGGDKFVCIGVESVRSGVGRESSFNSPWREGQSVCVCVDVIILHLDIDAINPEMFPLTDITELFTGGVVRTADVRWGIFGE
jgi:hypothetical protein